MAEALIQRKALGIRRCLSRVRDVLPANVKALRENLDAQDIIAVNLQRAVQLSVDIGAHLLSQHDDIEVPETMGGVFDGLQALACIEADVAAVMRAAVGFRNLSVHQYDEIDWDIVFAICTQHLDDFRRYLQQLKLSSE